jgi:diacylglycerol kinase (ATP)
MKPQGIADLSRIIRALRVSLAGIKIGVTRHTAFRQELLIAAVLIPLALFLGENGLQKAVLIGVLFMVLIVELLNSAIETVVDRINIEFHELSKRAKDLGSAAVFIALVSVPIVWILIVFG